MPDVTLTVDVLNWFPLDGLFAHVQADPWSDDPYAYGPAPASPTIGLGSIIGIMLLAIAFNCLMGWWGKSRAEDFGVNPWVGFALGFFMGFIGVALVPVFRTDRVFVTRKPPPMPQQPMQTNPMYSPGTQAYPQQGYAPPQQGYDQPPQGYGQPPQQQGFAPPMQQQYAPPPQPHAHSMQPGFEPPPQQPVEPAEMLVADEHGYVECPYCQSRTKSGRKACMNCGNFLPPVYDPNIK